MTVKNFACAVIIVYVVVSEHSLRALGRHYSNSDTSPKREKSKVLKSEGVCEEVKYFYQSRAVRREQ